MNIVLFQDITTEDALQKLEADGKKYEGLYVDMDNKDERKYIKDSASMISGLLKKLDRARIDKAREYKNSIEKEAESIRLRLEEANLPFTLLIDEHKEKRAKILSEEKAKEAAAALLIQIEVDHESALLEDKARAFEKLEQERLQKERDEEIARLAVQQAKVDAKRAVEKERERVEHERKLEEEAQAAREANKEYKAGINNTALKAIAEAGRISDAEAKAVLIAIIKGDVPAVTINY